MVRLQPSEQHQVRAAVPAAAGHSREFPSSARRKSVVGWETSTRLNGWTRNALCWKWCWNVTDFGTRCSDVWSLIPPMVGSPGCSLLFGQFFGKCPFVIDLSRPFKDVNCKPVVVVRGLQEWLSHRLLYCFHGWHESRVRHDRHPQNEATTQRAEMPGARPHGLGWNPQHS
jgi:hypothetical protein